MIFDELKTLDKMTLPVVKKVAFERIHSWLKGVTELKVENEYLDVNKPELVHFTLNGSTVTMLSRRKLNEDGLGKHLMYHPKRSCTLKLKHILEDDWF